MTVFFLQVRFFEKVVSVVTVFEADFIPLATTSNHAAIFDICTKVDMIFSK